MDLIVIGSVAALVAVTTPVFSQSQKNSNSSPYCEELYSRYLEEREYWSGRQRENESEFDLGYRFAAERLENVKRAFEYLAETIRSEAERYGCDAEKFDTSLDKSEED